MAKIALAMIVKGDDDEAEMLDRALECLSPHVDGIFITSTYKKGDNPNEKVNTVCGKYKANVSYFQWVNDFSKARNFNFSKVPKFFDYIMWVDADDVVQNPEKIKPLIEQNPSVDAFAFWYYYEIDKENNPIVIHKKTQIVRNDGCVEWVGKLHEDFKENRSLNVKFTDLITRVHLTTPEHAKENQKRNVEISKDEAKINPNDPRVYFNLANSYYGYGKIKEARTVYRKFIETSQSEDEKYLAYQRLSDVEKRLNNKDEAIKCLLIAIGMFPEIPDAFNQLGYLYFSYNMLDLAEKYLLIGLTIKPPYHKMIVFNPRDYDYNPMMALSKIYFNKSRPDLALPMLKGCSQIYPKDETIKNLVSEMDKEVKRQETVIEMTKEIALLGNDRKKILAKINSLPSDLQSHPAICSIRNKHFIKTRSTGKDIAYYCGPTSFDWNPDLFKIKGFGGSEEAVINLSRQWAKQGYNVTVFNSCGVEVMVRDGVTYKPYWHYNPKDLYDYTILWRSPKLVDYDLNTKKVFVDLHDVIPAGEFNEKRLSKIDKIFVKTQAQRSLFPDVPDEKFAIVPNGHDVEMFNENIERNPFMLINTSSPDRSLDVLPKLFMEVKKQVPNARLKWAYGWHNFDNSYANDKVKMAWKESVVNAMKEAGIEDLGRLPQSECAKLYQEGAILAYPSDFFEIDCISVKKAQLAGCIPVTTDFAAFNESNQYGIKIKSKKTSKDWAIPYQFTFGIQDEDVQNEWVEKVVWLLKNLDQYPVKQMKLWAKKFDWDLISKEWIKNLK